MEKVNNGKGFVAFWNRGLPAYEFGKGKSKKFRKSKKGIILSNYLLNWKLVCPWKKMEKSVFKPLSEFWVSKITGLYKLWNWKFVGNKW